MSLNESIVEDSALTWFGELGDEVGHGLHPSPAMSRPFPAPTGHHAIAQGNALGIRPQKVSRPESKITGVPGSVRGLFVVSVAMSRAIDPIGLAPMVKAFGPLDLAGVKRDPIRLARMVKEPYKRGLHPGKPDGGLSPRSFILAHQSHSPSGQAGWGLLSVLNDLQNNNPMGAQCGTGIWRDRFHQPHEPQDGMAMNKTLDDILSPKP